MRLLSGRKKKLCWGKFEMLPKLHIIIPVYNEKDNIEKTLDEIRTKIKCAFDISIIYDFEGDNTVPVVLRYMKDYPDVYIKLIKNDYGQGVLNAIKKGLDSVRDGAALVTMGDCSDDYSVVDDMWVKITEGYEVVCGSRYMKGGRQIGGPLIKGLMSRIAGVSLNLLTGIPTRDISNSFKMYSANQLKRVEIESTGGFEIGLEILVKAFAQKSKITEIPTVWKDRSDGESRFRLMQWLPRYLHWYFYAVRYKWLGMKPKVVNRVSEYENYEY
jgi:dolichol-phosphate mannosyltransferase